MMMALDLKQQLGLSAEGEGNYASTTTSKTRDRDTDHGLTLSPKIQSNDQWRKIEDISQETFDAFFSCDLPTEDVQEDDSWIEQRFFEAEPSLKRRKLTPPQDVDEQPLVSKSPTPPQANPSISPESCNDNGGDSFDLDMDELEADLEAALQEEASRTVTPSATVSTPTIELKSSLSDAPSSKAYRSPYNARALISRPTSPKPKSWSKAFCPQHRSNPTPRRPRPLKPTIHPQNRPHVLVDLTQVQVEQDIQSTCDTQDTNGTENTPDDGFDFEDDGSLFGDAGTEEPSSSFQSADSLKNLSSSQTPRPYPPQPAQRTFPMSHIRTPLTPCSINLPMPTPTPQSSQSTSPTAGSQVSRPRTPQAVPLAPQPTFPNTWMQFAAPRVEPTPPAEYMQSDDLQMPLMHPDLYSVEIHSTPSSTPRCGQSPSSTEPGYYSQPPTPATFENNFSPDYLRSGSSTPQPLGFRPPPYGASHSLTYPGPTVSGIQVRSSRQQGLVWKQCSTPQEYARQNMSINSQQHPNAKSYPSWMYGPLRQPQQPLDPDTLMASVERDLTPEGEALRVLVHKTCHIPYLSRKAAGEYAVEQGFHAVVRPQPPGPPKNYSEKSTQAGSASSPPPQRPSKDQVLEEVSLLLQAKLAQNSTGPHIIPQNLSLLFDSLEKKFDQDVNFRNSVLTWAIGKLEAKRTSNHQLDMAEVEPARDFPVSQNRRAYLTNKTEKKLETALHKVEALKLEMDKLKSNLANMGKYVGYLESVNRNLPQAMD